MQITSPAFQNGESIPVQYSCEGLNISPPLRFIDVPKEAGSLALLVEDPDAGAEPFVHWIAYNIPPQMLGFDEGSVAKEVSVGIGSSNTYAYEGPCPPKGEHRYFFRLFALSKNVNIPDGADKKTLLQAIKGQMIEEATLVGKYEKQKIGLKQF